MPGKLYLYTKPANMQKYLSQQYKTLERDIKRAEKANADWIHVEGVQDRSQEKIFRSRLHAGEVEVMLLALQSDADLVILDDMLARKTAKYMGLTVSGTLIH